MSYSANTRLETWYFDRRSTGDGDRKAFVLRPMKTVRFGNRAESYCEPPNISMSLKRAASGVDAFTLLEPEEDGTLVERFAFDEPTPGSAVQSFGWI